jgi:hypothetical protein
VFGQSGDFIAGAGAGSADFIGSTAILFGQSGIFSASASPSVIQTLGNIGPWRTDAEEKLRQRQFKELADAERELRETIAALVRGDKAEAQDKIEQAVESLKDAETEPATPAWIIREISSLRSKVVRQAHKNTMKRQQVQAMADTAARIERQMRDDEDAVTLLLM